MIEVFLDLEISLVKTLGWSLYDIDETDASDLMDFVRRMNETRWGNAAATLKRAYCDQIEWM